MAIIEASGDLAPLQGASKVKVLFCADATPIKACRFKFKISNKIGMLYQRCGGRLPRGVTSSSMLTHQKRACP
jgi:hypothetical protein